MWTLLYFLSTCHDRSALLKIWHGKFITLVYENVLLAQFILVCHDRSVVLMKIWHGSFYHIKLVFHLFAACRCRSVLMKNMTWQNPMLGCGLWLHNSFLCVINLKVRTYKNLRWQILALGYELWLPSYFVCVMDRSVVLKLWCGMVWTFGCPTISYMSRQVSNLEVWHGRVSTFIAHLFPRCHDRTGHYFSKIWHFWSSWLSC